MVSTSWIGLGDPTLGVGPKFVTSNIRPGVPYTNIARYSDPLVDELWAKAGTEIDPSKRTEIFKQIQKKIVEDSPEVFVFELKQVPIARKEVRNLLHGAFTVQGPMYETWLER
jgi:peptide/nickel transport system substrate-binding protein